MAIRSDETLTPESLLADLGLGAFDPGLAGVVQGAAAAVAPESPLPPWAQELRRIHGYQPGDPDPELFVYMKDVPGIKGVEGVDTPRGFGDVSTVGGKPAGSVARTMEQALNLPYLWDEEELASAMERFRAAGAEVDSFDDVVKMWSGLVNRASKMYTFSEGERKVTPWDVLDMYKSEAGDAAAGEPDPNRQETFTQKSVSTLSEGEAWSSLQNTLSNMLGRDPSDQELRDFTYRMNQLAAANPAISKTITQYKDGTAVSSQTTQTEAGFSAADVAMSAYEGAQSDPEYAEYQAASTYFNAAQSALGAIGS